MYNKFESYHSYLNKLNRVHVYFPSLEFIDIIFQPKLLSKRSEDGRNQMHLISKKIKKKLTLIYSKLNRSTTEFQLAFKLY